VLAKLIFSTHYSSFQCHITLKSLLFGVQETFLIINVENSCVFCWTESWTELNQTLFL